MHLNDLISTDELEGLPDDNDLAFLNFLEITRPKFDQIAKNLQDSNTSRNLSDARYTYLTYIIAAAKQYQYTPLQNQALPPFQSFSHSYYRSLITEIDRATASLILKQAHQNKSNSVQLNASAKSKISSYLNVLKDEIEKSDLDQLKKDKLLKKIEEFEEELSKRKTNIAAATLLVIQLLGVPGSLWASYEITSKLSTQVLQVLAEAKAHQDEQRSTNLMQTTVPQIEHSKEIS